MSTRRRVLPIAFATFAMVVPTCTPPGPGQTPTPPAPPSEQGVDANEEVAADRLVPALLTQDRIAMVAAARRSGTDFVYSVYSDLDRDGVVTKVEFRRTPKADGTYDYPRTAPTGDADPGQDPLDRTDPKALAAREDEVAVQNGAAFLPLSATTFPYACERIAAAFDHPGAGDLLLVHSPAGTDGHYTGNHGNLDVTQSRSPLILSGAGIRPADGTPTGSYGALARLVDVAPTAAKAIGIRTMQGKRLDGSAGTTYLARQDGRVLSEVLDGTTAQQVVIIVSDGMSHTRLRQLIERGQLPNIAQLVARGGFFEYGAIGNFPSNTYPGHNVIGTGCYSGHHGLLDNDWVDRKQRVVTDPYHEKIGTSDYIRSDVETLFDAATRTFGKWDGALGGAYTVSVFDPCARGAELQVLELSAAGGFPVPEGECPVVAPAGLSPYLTAGVALNQFSTMLVQRQFLEAGSKHPAPKVTILNLPLTDMLGHELGPHHAMADPAYVVTDACIGYLMKTLQKMNLFQNTLFVLTADHGMAQQDPATPGTIGDALRQAGVEAKFSSERFLYLECLDVAAPAGLAKGKSQRVEVVVKDDDYDAFNVRPPVPETAVTIQIGSQRWAGRTDWTGKVTFDVAPPAGASEATLVVDAPGYTRVERKIPIR